MVASFLDDWRRALEARNGEHVNQYIFNDLFNNKCVGGWAGCAMHGRRRREAFWCCFAAALTTLLLPWRAQVPG